MESTCRYELGLLKHVGRESGHLECHHGQFCSIQTSWGFLAETLAVISFFGQLQYDVNGAIGAFG